MKKTSKHTLRLATFAGYALAILIGTVLVLSKNNDRVRRNDLKARLDSLEVVHRILRKELAAIAPIAEGIPQSPADGLDQGWVARVYELPSKNSYTLPGDEIGAFVMDEVRFDLRAHEGHLIEHPMPSAYRLTGVYPARDSGRHQFGLMVSADNLEEPGSWKSGEMTHCKFTMSLNGQQFMSSRVVFNDLKPERLLVGNAELDEGLHFAEVTVVCHLKPHQKGSDIRITVLNRTPRAQTLSPKKLSIFHRKAI